VATELSPAATDLLFEQLQLGAPPPLFEIPSVGSTLEERARLRDDLIIPDEATVMALTTLVRFDHAVEGVVAGSPVVFRSATNGRTAVLATKRDQKIRIAPCRPDGLVSAVLPLIGNRKPGPGRSVSYPDVDDPSPETGILRQVRPPAGNYGAERRFAKSILAKPRTRSGWFTVLARDRAGRETAAPPVIWFDTADGRYAAHRRPGPDGELWATCTPADTTRIGRLLDLFMELYGGNTNSGR
jgi:hypothetical protein